MAGAFTAGGQFMQLLAAKYAPANRIAPTHYSQIVWAVILGALFFKEYPDWLLARRPREQIGQAAGLLTMVRGDGSRFTAEISSSI